MNKAQRQDNSNFCIQECKKGKKAVKKLLNDCESVFSAVADFEDFKKEHCKDCPRNK